MKKIAERPVPTELPHFELLNSRITSGVGIKTWEPEVLLALYCPGCDHWIICPETKKSKEVLCRQWEAGTLIHLACNRLISAIQVYSKGEQLHNT